jgi:D-glycero-D-manno-heptose 1,7-bisphosphate phosphatase
VSERSRRGAVFLDRDGVLNDVVWRAGVPASPRVLAEFTLAPDLDALAALRAAGVPLFVVTNQPDIARGLLAPAVLDACMARVRAAVRCTDVRCCTHDDADGCACRKPLPGMLRDLALLWNVDLGASYMVGDSWRDVEAGRAAGCTTVLLRRLYNEDVQADIEVRTLAEAAAVLLERMRTE